MEPVAQRTVESAGAGLTAVEYNVPAAVERLGTLTVPHVTADASAAAGLSVLEIGALIWLTGLLAAAVYAAASDVRLRRRLRTAVLLEGNVYEAEGIPTAFVLGLARPASICPSVYRRRSGRTSCSMKRLICGGATRGGSCWRFSCWRSTGGIPRCGRASPFLPGYGALLRRGGAA